MWEKIIGWYGAGAIVLSYALLQFNVLGVHSLWYFLLNVSGALGIVVTSFAKRNWPPLALNAFWALISIFGMIRYGFS